MKSSLLFFLFLFIHFISFGQEQEQIPLKNTHLNILTGINMTYSGNYSSYSEGGEWGVSMSHYLKDENFGFSTGIGFNMLHFGFDEGYTKSSEGVFRFRYLETPLTLIFRPISSNPSIQMELGGSIYIHMNNGGFGETNNVFVGIFSAQKNFNFGNGLSFAIGLKGKYFSINQDNYGQMGSITLFTKTGLQQ